MAHPSNSRMAAAAIFNFGKISITPDWIKISAPNFMGRHGNFGKMSITLDWIKISHIKLYGKMHNSDAEMTT